MNMNFYLPTRVITGTDCIRREAHRLASFGDRVLLVTGAHGAKTCGALDDVTAALESQHIRWALYDGIAQNPTVASCRQAADQAIACGARFILGIGGGSVLDAAKAIAVFAANPGMDQAGLYTLNWHRKPLPIVCVGTTAGTGSEVTAVSVLTRADGTKKSITHDSLYPALSITDPAYTSGMSDYYTRSTAIDALAHCVESWFSRKANAISRCWAEEGIRTLLPPLQKIAAHGCCALTEDDRTALYHGSLYGGLAISVTGTLFPHTVGYPLTELFGVPHGIACAFFLPDLVEHLRACEPALTDVFFHTCGCREAELLRIAMAVMPACDVRMTPAQIAALNPRWENNRSLHNTPGQVDGAFVDALYRHHFIR